MAEMSLPNETYFQALDPRPFVSTGIPFPEACKHHAIETFAARRIYLIVSKSIGATANFTSLHSALGARVIGVRRGIRQHVPWPDVLEVAADLRSLSADLIVTLGGGSLTDAAKVAALAAANDASTLDDLEALHLRWKTDIASLRPCAIPTINIPTTLSGGEYNTLAGATDLRDKRKKTFNHPSTVAHVVILDPALAVSSPERLWLSSGVRSVDHCVEGLCSVVFRPGRGEGLDQAKVETELKAGLARLLPNLIATKQRPDDLEARRSEMLGVVDTFRGLMAGVSMGASHGIGHQLGPLGVGHGETSCVMLASVLRWNREHGDAWVDERQRRVLDVFWADQTVADVLRRAGLDSETATLGDAVEVFVKALGLPTSLREVGIGADKLDKLAASAMTDRDIKTNPVAITDEGQIRAILEMALGR